MWPTLFDIAVLLYSITLHFSPKFVSLANDSNIYQPNEFHRRLKISPLKIFGIKTLSNPIVSTLHWSKNNILSFSNFLQKKFPGLTKKFLHFFFTTLEVVIWKSRVAKAVDLFNKGEKIFRQARKLTEFYFWANVMLRQPHVWASSASPTQKLQGLRVV